MARPKKSINFIRVGFSLEKSHLEKLRQIAGYRQLESGKVVTTSQVLRDAIEAYMAEAEI